MRPRTSPPAPDPQQDARRRIPDHRAHRADDPGLLAAAVASHRRRRHLPLHRRPRAADRPARPEPDADQRHVPLPARPDPARDGRCRRDARPDPPGDRAVRGVDSSARSRRSGTRRLLPGRTVHLLGPDTPSGRIPPVPGGQPIALVGRPAAARRTPVARRRPGGRRRLPGRGRTGEQPRPRLADPARRDAGDLIRARHGHRPGAIHRPAARAPGPQDPQRSHPGRTARHRLAGGRDPRPRPPLPHRPPDQPGSPPPARRRLASGPPVGLRSGSRRRGGRAGRHSPERGRGGRAGPA